MLVTDIKERTTIACESPEDRHKILSLCQSAGLRKAGLVGNSSFNVAPYVVIYGDGDYQTCTRDVEQPIFPCCDFIDVIDTLKTDFLAHLQERIASYQKLWTDTKEAEKQSPSEDLALAYNSFAANLLSTKTEVELIMITFKKMFGLVD